MIEFMRTFTALLTLSVFLSIREAHATGVSACKRFDLSENKNIADSQLKIGQSQVFVDEQGELHGFEILKNNKTIAWTNHAHISGDKFFIRRCESLKQKPEWLDDEGRGVYGDCSDKWSYIEPNSGSPKPIQLNAPGYDFLSHGSFCKNHLAYFGLEKSGQCKQEGSYKVDAIVFSLKEMKVSQREHLGCFVLETDNEAHFPEPEWNGKTVTFEPEPKRKVKLNVGD